MIKLTLQVGSHQAEKVFDQETVILGAGSADLHGLPLEVAGLRPEHVKIFEKEGAFFAQNLANDPFVTLNGRPFGKKRLTPGDRLTLAGAEIIIEGYAKPLESVQAPLDEVIRKTSPSSPLEQEVDVDALIREVENFSSAPKQEEAPALAEQDTSFKASALQGALTETQARVGRETIARQATKASKHWTPRSLRDRPFNGIRREGEEGDGVDGLGVDGRSRYRYWRPFVAFLIVLVAVLAAIGSGVYFTFNEKNDEQEFIAAQGLADISIGLTYAQLNQIKSPNQNWGDPDFLHDMLAKVLPPYYPSLIAVDKQGGFENCPYMLRVYTSGDLSQFLLIAQPEPNLWQWLLARDTILLDSRTMELHRTKDLRALNRLLANPKPLEGANALEVSHLISQTPIIRLTTVAAETGHREFLPPKGLNKQRPGAEFRVYNAPRYYLLSSPLAQAMSQITTATSEEKVQNLRRSVTDLAKMSQFVFYSSTDESASRKVLDLLRTWVPADTAAVAQLNLEAGESGRILSSHIITYRPSEQPEEPPTYQRLPSDDVEVAVTEQNDLVPAEQVDVQYTIQKAFTTAAGHRRQALAPYRQQLVELLDAHVANHDPAFTEEVSQLISDFEDVELGQQVDIRQAIVEAYRIHVLEGKELTHDQFIAEVKGAGLEGFLPPEFFEHAAAPIVAQELSAEHTNAFATHIEEVQLAQDLPALEEAIDHANQELIAEPLMGSDRLRMMRNKLQVHVLHRLEQLILGSSSPLSPTAFNPHNRTRVQKILLSAGVEDQEQRDYYLHEFDLLTAEQAAPEEE